MRRRAKKYRRFLVPGVLLLLTLLAFSWSGCVDEPEKISSPAPAEVAKSAPTAEVLDMDTPAVQAAAEVQERHTAGLLSKEDIVGTGIGADADGNPVILILTRRPGVANLPSRLDGFATRVDVVGEIRPLASYKGIYRPVPGGVSVGNDRECASGTLGCIVLKSGTP